MLKFIILFFPLVCFSYPKSDHFDGDHFFNPVSNHLKSFWDLLKWKMTSTPEKWPEKVLNKNHSMRQIMKGEKSNITFINHATFLIQYQDLNVLTDPIYSERASPVGFAGPKRVREAGLLFDSLPKIDVVIISHNHYDHLDLETLKKLDEKFNPLILVPLGDEKLLLHEGLKNVKALDWWEEERIKDIKFTFTPSQHWSARGLWDKNECLWGSFMIDSGVQKIYFGGDTGYGKHFLDIKNRIGPPDIALLPIGAYKPRWFMKFHHMDPEEAVMAHVDLSAKQSIAMHFGTFQMADEGINDPVTDLNLALLKFKISSDEFLVLDEGETVSY